MVCSSLEPVVQTLRQAGADIRELKLEKKATVDLLSGGGD
jgi:hypothetical protein